MVKLKENTLLREIPNSLLLDKKVTKLAKSLQNSLDKRVQWINKLNYTIDLENLDDAVLEHLLWEKHIEWNEGLNLATTREQKINLIRSSRNLHQHKGTPYAIERVLEALEIKGEVLEWWEYDAPPYHFNVELELTRYIKDIKEVEVLVLEYKNVRSWFDGFVMILGKKYILLIGDSYHYPVFYLDTGHFTGEKGFHQGETGEVNLIDDSYAYEVEYPVNEKEVIDANARELKLVNDSYEYIKEFETTGEMEPLSKGVSTGTAVQEIKNDTYGYEVIYPICGEFYAEAEEDD